MKWTPGGSNKAGPTRRWILSPVLAALHPTTPHYNNALPTGDPLPHLTAISTAVSKPGKRAVRKQSIKSVSRVTNNAVLMEENNKENLLLNVVFLLFLGLRSKHCAGMGLK